MRIVLQRVRRAKVWVRDEVKGEIGRGMVLLVGVRRGDSHEDARWLAHRCSGLRIFEDGEGKMNLSLLDIGGEALVVSQFTLYGDTRKGMRPSFTEAAPLQEAEALYRTLVETLKAEGVPVRTGEFGARMLVEIENEGPVTLILER
ncbi:MAG TPA: D-tyrosyl-tRNA(Tyr) deacylase [Candidatus Latescibacteria bacterium]|nr:D-tyrosyl-tRNA(Tyr) deacylase [Candidatus Latescibacterota bacterium]